MAAEKRQMTTLSEVINTLEERGHGDEFRMTDKGLTINEQVFFQPSDLTIIKTYRFEGDSNPDDESILFLIETSDKTIGYLIDAYGVYSTVEPERYIQFIREIRVEDRDEQLIFG
ncbi:MAG: hypothetical protein J0I84_08245 [Terrimonas sp.]|uniref:hypothetical protein n=1 Tax=Terrimonas sp. TaxID=1914338 RepID=UPI000926B239|nr:hypothetical protein [Terrimonas sp.]MBN8787066.1 hypothetical protein [Terrimonas sp.]OJY99765.1 MAG: hypothetical protein BGP13_08825 [Sphingobacteriales bacterium 40-81]PVD53524.1 hypothetical protein DC498_03115 [Terrimonas sp.]